MIQEAKGINNAGLLLSLHPNVPLSPSPSLSLPFTSTFLYISPSFFLSTVFVPDLSSLFSSD